MTKQCPKCSKELVLRNGKQGAFYGCKGYPNCRYTENAVVNTTQNAPQGATANLNNNPDVYDLLTSLVAKVNAIYDKLNQEMPEDPFNEA